MVGCFFHLKPLTLAQAFAKQVGLARFNTAKAGELIIQGSTGRPAVCTSK
jgi:hypothetical protein